MRALIIVAVLASGCFDDRYRCTSDAQCNIGEGGRCEKDQFCTKFDDTCFTGRRYQHAGDHGDACFDDRVVPRNACAGGQAPAKKEGCFADVCERVPACCEMAWTDACVQLAQTLCSDFTCDTRIAITARQGALVELWDLRWNGSWMITKRDDLRQPLQWVAPAPGDADPRLAAMTVDGSLFVREEDPIRLPTEPNRLYTSITSINIDRDLRDTIVVGHIAVIGADPRVDIIKVKALTQRPTQATSAIGLVWGDLDRDKFADAIARTTNQAQYHFLPSRDESENHVRDLRTGTMVAPQGGPTGNIAPTVRNVDWVDVDGDKRLDLVAFASELRIHMDAAGLVEVPDLRADCNPPITALGTSLPACPAVQVQNHDNEAFAFGGAARPTKTANELIVTTYPGRELRRASLDGDRLVFEKLPFPGESCMCTRTCPTPCPNPCSCDITCPSCLPIVAVVVRDLDGDRELDIVAIDSKLSVYHSFARSGFVEWVTTTLGTMVTGEGFNSISTSVSGARL